MFYYPNVLQRHTGCFSTIWLAATRGIRVTRREFLKVNVNQTCREILDYVTAQVLAPQPDQPRPRFSLYLSSQLQYGVVVVYHRQCGFLLEEIQQTIDRLLRSKTYKQISMADTDRVTFDLPDGLFTMEETEGALDPFFGLMESQQLPSPYKIHQVEFEVSVQRSVEPSPDKESFSSPSAAITLTEKEPFVINAAECFEGDDLPEATIKEIDLLMDQPDQFRQEVVEEKTEDRTGDQGVVSPTGPLKETTLGTDGDSQWPLDEKTGQAAVAVEMTPPNVAMPSEDVEDQPAESPCEEVAPPPTPRRHRGRRRQLVFVDPEVQISEGAMKEQIENPLTETQTLNKVLLDLPASTRRAAPAQLFSAPCCQSLIHPELLLLWKQQASLAVLPSSEERRGVEGESEQDMEVVRAERRRRSRIKEPLGASGLRSSEGPSAVDVMLDLSKEDKSGSGVMTPVSKWSPQEDAQPPMDAILEEAIELPEAQFDPESRTSASWISSALQHHEEVTFGSILPPEADCFTAAQTLYRLLAPGIKLAEDKTQEGDAERAVIVRVEVEQELPMSVTLPIEVQAGSAHRPFPFLDTTLADLGIQESDVKERVVWVDTKKTQVKNKTGKLKEKETTVLEVRVKAQKPGDKQLQEVLYSTEAHTDRSFCRTGINIQPWTQRHAETNGLKPVERTVALDQEDHRPGLTEVQDH